MFCEDVVGVGEVKNGVIHATSGWEWVGYDGLLSHAWNFPSLQCSALFNLLFVEKYSSKI